MQLEIVTHCVRYARLLSYQIGSLAAHSPEGVEVVYTLFFSPDDAATAAVVTRAGARAVPGVHWNWQPLPLERLNRRAIGRNLAALATAADWVWFADADFCFGPGCLAALAARAADRPEPLLFPRRVGVTTHAAGDALVATVNGVLPALPRAAFTERQRFNRATGGIQIVRGEICRKGGYLRDEPHWQRPQPTWRDCRDDVAFRRTLGTRGGAIRLPEIYRIRHSAKGVGGAVVAI